MGRLYSVSSQIQVHHLRVAVDYNVTCNLNCLVTVTNRLPASFLTYIPQLLDLSDVTDVDKTATEVKIAKKRKYNMVSAIQENLKDCLEDLVYALAFYNAKLHSGYEFNCTFKDSILVDDETERQNDRADVSLGAMQLWEYRMKHYAEDEETAKKMVVQQADVIED